MSQLYRHIFSRASIVPAMVLAFFFSACDLTDLDKSKFDSYTPDFATQIINADMNLGNIVAERVKDSSLRVFTGADKFYYFSATTIKYSKTLEEALALPRSQPGNLDFPAFPASVPATATTMNRTWTFDAGDADAALTEKRKLKYILMKSGNISVRVNSNNLGTRVKATMTFLGIAKPETPNTNFSVSVTLPATDTVVNFTANLTGYAIDFSKSTTNNSVTVQLNMEPIPATGGTYNAGGRVTSEVNLESMDIKYIEGYLGAFHMSVDEADTLALKFFNNSFDPTNEMYFINPRVECSIYSSVGAPIIMRLSKVRSYTKAGQVADLKVTNPALNNPLYINVNPAERNPLLLGLAPTSLTRGYSYSRVDSTNSNITAVAGKIGGVLSTAPNRIGYTFNVGSDSSRHIDYWGFDTSRIGFVGHLTLPLDGRVTSFTVQDTITLNLPEYDANADVEKVIIKLHAENGLPVNAAANLYFITDTDERIDSLVESKLTDANAIIIKGAMPGSDGKVPAGVSEKTDRKFAVTHERYKNLLDKKVTKAIFKARLTTTNAAAGTISRIYPEYRLKLQVGVRIGAKINLND
ncbi:MAG: hypothetical protein V4543_03955 [Bacteroidota bacterium]